MANLSLMERALFLFSLAEIVRFCRLTGVASIVVSLPSRINADSLPWFEWPEEKDSVSRVRSSQRALKKKKKKLI